jgi:hypothetical protein
MSTEHDGTPKAGEFTVLDWIGAVLTCFSAMALVSFPIAGREFGSMYQDFGATDPPLLSKLAISAWFPPVLGAVVVAMITLGLRPRASLTQRRAFFVSGFIFGCLSFAICLVGLYLPLFQMAGAIKP